MLLKQKRPSKAGNNEPFFCKIKKNKLNDVGTEREREVENKRITLSSANCNRLVVETQTKQKGRTVNVCMFHFLFALIRKKINTHTLNHCKAKRSSLIPCVHGLGGMVRRKVSFSSLQQTNFIFSPTRFGMRQKEINKKTNQQPLKCSYIKQAAVVEYRKDQEPEGSDYPSPRYVYVSVKGNS